ncbi:MAG: cell division protein ZapA [Rhodospirillales bacterium]|jgi:cell division protein ZapA|nr:cell division protein ZapA [Rhodospirillales bacterium]MBT4040614.1 cell division protein ZapA [Rhodospirillales bacterium]MBT4627971.1 cell division protein ZapA [Rhodospirillales bacterium]MBT5352621.1 cell division protein ZapA [Rhodospirillales bacterium]MBT5520646.1 cell division protein ZapA [Rhodospirillales bacterium]
MAQVDVSINGRVYTVACGDGEETHLIELGRMVDERVSQLTGAVGQIGDAKLLVMASLLIADEMSDISRQLADMESASGNTPSGSNAGADTDDELIAQGLENIAERIEGIADRLEHP